jgi:hypothetical protein
MTSYINKYPKQRKTFSDTDLTDSLDLKIKEHKKFKDDFETENKEELNNFTINKAEIDQLEAWYNSISNNIKTKEKEYSDMNDESKNEIELRVINEQNILNDAKLRYNEIKTQIDSLIIPVSLRKNASKDEMNKYDKEKENIRLMKNKLTNILRNKEIDVEMAENNLQKAIKLPSNKDLLRLQIKQLIEELDVCLKKLNKSQSSYKHKLILKTKLNKFEEDLNIAIEEKEKYERRGISICSKNGIINYDENGNLIKKSYYNEMIHELNELENNIPMKEEYSINIPVKTEYDFLVEYYNNRYELTKPYIPSNFAFNDLKRDKTHDEWALDSMNELKDIKLKIIELKKNLYTNDIWLEIDKQKYNQLKQDIYKKYDYLEVKKPIVESKDYTIDDFMKSIKCS